MAKILFIGDISTGQTSHMRMRALARLGHVIRGVQTIDPWTRTTWISRQIQRRLQRGPVVDEINHSVLEAARSFRPQFVWAEKQEYLRAESIEKIRQWGATLIHFTPDPYFALDWKRTRLMDEAMKAFDVLIYCKSYEREGYQALGKPLLYMPLGYCDEVHRPLPSGDPRWMSAVGFLGGWEPRRERLLHAIAAAGLELKIWGVHWDFLRDGIWTPRRHAILRQFAGDAHFNIRRDNLIAQAHQGGEVYADEYARALTGAKIGLGLLRKVCPDQHTTRTFEIPACGSMLLADRTEEHLGFFQEGKEAEFFATDEELLDKIKFYGSNESARQRIAAAGYNRCIEGKYAYVHRMRAALDQVNRC